MELLERFPLIYFSTFFALKDTLKDFDEFKNKQNSVCKSIWYIFWKCIQYTIYWDRTQMLKKFLSDNLSDAEKCSFLFRELQLVTVLLFICNSHMSWSAMFVSPKLCVGFPIFNSISLLFKFMFLFYKFKTSKFLSRLK